MGTPSPPLSRVRAVCRLLSRTAALEKTRRKPAHLECQTTAGEVRFNRQDSQDILIFSKTCTLPFSDPCGAQLPSPALSLTHRMKARGTLAGPCCAYGIPFIFWGLKIYHCVHLLICSTSLYGMLTMSPQTTTLLLFKGDNKST